MTTHYWSDFVPNSTLYRLMSGFYRTFATDVACRQLLFRSPCPVPLGLAYVLLVETNPFSELVVIFTKYALRISLGTFSILLDVIVVIILNICVQLTFIVINHCAKVTELLLWYFLEHWEAGKVPLFYKLIKNMHCNVLQRYTYQSVD